MLSATVSQDCITAYNDLKLSKKYKYIIYKLSDNYKEIVVEEASEDKDWENFREKLVNATTKTRSVRRAPMPHLSYLCSAANILDRAPLARAPVTPSTTSSIAWHLATVSGS